MSDEPMAPVSAAVTFWGDRRGPLVRSESLILCLAKLGALPANANSAGGQIRHVHTPAESDDTAKSLKHVHHSVELASLERVRQDRSIQFRPDELALDFVAVNHSRPDRCTLG